MAGFVKYYNQCIWLGASLALELPGDWEHVIPKAVIRMFASQSQQTYNVRSLYYRGIVISLHRGLHRRYVPTTGSSNSAKAFRAEVAGLFNEGSRNEAVSLLIDGELYAIKTYCENNWGISMEEYVPALGAVLYEYNQLEIITPDCVYDNYYKICRELAGWVAC